MATSSEESGNTAEEKIVTTQIENVHTNERVPGHLGYYEKGGLRTYGDEEDHDHEPPVYRSLVLASSSIRLIPTE